MSVREPDFILRLFDGNRWISKDVYGNLEEAMAEARSAMDFTTSNGRQSPWAFIEIARLTIGEARVEQPIIEAQWVLLRSGYKALPPRED